MSWQPAGWDQAGWQPEGWDQQSGAVIAEVTRRVFRVHREQSIFRAIEMTASNEHRIEDHPGVAPGESVLVEINLLDLCTRFWRANKAVTSGQFIRPSKSTGFSYECTTTGLTGFREPRWPTTIVATVTDGSAVWTCRAASTNGISAISGESAASDPSGLTVSSVSVVDSTSIIATYDATSLSDGDSFDVVYTFTLDGVTRKARQTVPIVTR